VWGFLVSSGIFVGVTYKPFQLPVWGFPGSPGNFCACDEQDIVFRQYWGLLGLAQLHTPDTTIKM